MSSDLASDFRLFPAFEMHNERSGSLSSMFSPSPIKRISNVTSSAEHLGPVDSAATKEAQTSTRKSGTDEVSTSAQNWEKAPTFPLALRHQ